MGAPKGFRQANFNVTKDPNSPIVYCLVCEECSAMVLQNDFGDFANKHREWHEKTEKGYYND